MENAEHAKNVGVKVGESILYACLDGLTKVGGDSYLTCSLSQDGAALWNGEFIKCDRKSGKYLWKYVKLHPTKCSNFENQK